MVLLRWMDETLEGRLVPTDFEVNSERVLEPLSWDEFVPYFLEKMRTRPSRRGRPSGSKKERKNSPHSITEAQLMNQLDELRIHGRLMRAQWKKAEQRRREYRARKQSWDEEWRGFSTEEKRGRHGEAVRKGRQWKKARADWKQLQQRRREIIDEGRAQRGVIRKQLQQLRGEVSEVLERGKVMVLGIIDDCTREVYDLPVFETGTSVTSQEVADATSEILPETLQTVISDNGSHFTGRPFTSMLTVLTIAHLLIFPGRPCSNGLIERFFRTLKWWLRDKSWADPAELRVLISEFLVNYNRNRPHQALNGLSPLEYKEQKLLGISDPTSPGKSVYRDWWGPGPPVVAVAV